MLGWWADVLGWRGRTQAEEAEATARQFIDIYADCAISVAAMPVIAGRKSRIESFAGANTTYTIEAMMGDGRALQVPPPFLVPLSPLRFGERRLSQRSFSEGMFCHDNEERLCRGSEERFCLNSLERFCHGRGEILPLQERLWHGSEVLCASTAENGSATAAMNGSATTARDGSATTARKGSATILPKVIPHKRR